MFVVQSQNCVWLCITMTWNTPGSPVLHYLRKFAQNHVYWVQFSSVTRRINSLWSHELQHARLPCPSPTPVVYPNSCPLSRWCLPTILSSVIHFSSCRQSFPASWSFQMSHLFASDGQSLGVSASTSVLPMNTQIWSPLGWRRRTPWSPRDSQESSPTPQFKSTNSFFLILFYF